MIYITNLKTLASILAELTLAFLAFPLLLIGKLALSLLIIGMCCLPYRPRLALVTRMVRLIP